jgi:hypothetical protein
LANTTGVAIAVLAAVGFALWKLSRTVTHKVFGNPDANPPTPGAVDRYLDNQKKFFDGLSEHSARQQLLCERHADSLETIGDVIAKCDLFAKSRDEAIATLLKIHTDPNIEGSTAEAIESIGQLKQVAVHACAGCREAINGKPENVRDVVVKHCEAIERILKLTS